jgi:hypothetical protein
LVTDVGRRVEHDACRRVAILERRRIYERLERRSRLAARLDGAVEIVEAEVEAAVQRDDRSVERIDGDECSLRFGNLREAPRAFRRSPKPHDVAGLQNLGNRRRFGSHAVVVDEDSGPLDGIEPDRLFAIVGEENARADVIGAQHQRALIVEQARVVVEQRA